jgi:hypothetical protein
MKKEKLAEEVIEPEKTEKPEAKEKLSPFLEAYKKQNPVKYEAKKASGELKGL